MMSNKIKKMLAVVLAMVMVLGMSITSYAATGEDTGSGSGTGEGTFEGSVDKDVISVTLPTATESTFGFLLDPEGLIAATANAKYPDATFEEGANVFFQSAANTYTKESAKLKVINKGTVDVDVTVSANAVGGVVDVDDAGLGITDSTDWATVSANVGNKVLMADDAEAVSMNDLPVLYLGLQVANQEVVAVKADEDVASVAVGVSGNDANYEVTYSAQDGYKFTVKNGVAETAWNSFEFNLVGDCNTDGNWTTADLEAPDVQLTWKFEVRDEASVAPYVEENAVSDVGPLLTKTGTETASYVLATDTPIDIAYSVGTGDLEESLSTITYAFAGESTYNTVASSFYSQSGNTITLTGAAANAFKNKGGATVKLTFSNGTVLTVTLTTS